MQGLGFCGLNFFALTTCGSKYLLEDIYPGIQKSCTGVPGLSLSPAAIGTDCLIADTCCRVYIEPSPFCAIEGVSRSPGRR